MEQRKNPHQTPYTHILLIICMLCITFNSFVVTQPLNFATRGHVRYPNFRRHAVCRNSGSLQIKCLSSQTGAHNSLVSPFSSCSQLQCPVASYHTILITHSFSLNNLLLFSWDSYVVWSSQISFDSLKKYTSKTSPVDVNNSCEDLSNLFNINSCHGDTPLK